MYIEDRDGCIGKEWTAGKVGRWMNGWVGGWIGKDYIVTQSLSSSNLLPSPKFHFLKVSQPSKSVPLAGEQYFKHMNLYMTLHIKTTTPLTLRTKMTVTTMNGSTECSVCVVILSESSLSPPFQPVLT